MIYDKLNWCSSTRGERSRGCAWSAKADSNFPAEVAPAQWSSTFSPFPHTLVFSLISFSFSSWLFFIYVCIPTFQLGSCLNMFARFIVTTNQFFLTLGGIALNGWQCHISLSNGDAHTWPSHHIRALISNKLLYCTILQYTAIYFNILQCTAPLALCFT